MRERFLSHWRGIAISVIGIVATVWLAVTDQLGLYIHPRYFVFTVVMAVIGAVFVVLAFAMLPTSDGREDHDHNEQQTSPQALWRSLSWGLLAVVAFALLALPPATLTSSTVEQRDMNASVGQGDEPVELVGGSSDSLTVRDWATLLRSGADESFLSEERPTLVGFVTPDDDDPDNVFYVARFVVTCCAVDAQPIGVPVYSPGWKEQFDIDSWVSVTGTFVANPSVSSMQPTVVTPDTVESTERPSQPYVY